MVTVNVLEAKTHLSRLLHAVEAGEEVIISRAGKPIARLSPIETRPRKKISWGRDIGKFVVPDDFNDPLPEDIQAVLEGRAD